MVEVVRMLGSAIAVVFAGCAGWGSCDGCATTIPTIVRAAQVRRKMPRLLKFEYRAQTCYVKGEVSKDVAHEWKSAVNNRISRR
ncbi:hypothetical protein JB92DRAFT_2914368 [Gautieria morchelliformis]|nr:hypothetical protein JB92DRAFT_2914368 [Gautieria morchelliformis]